MVAVQETIYIEAHLLSNRDSNPLVWQPAAVAGCFCAFRLFFRARAYTPNTLRGEGEACHRRN